ncbi:MAG: hypothetical protein Q8O95_04565 [bacterium]|nr:hypothetical protein [bacterium]
MAIIQPLGSSDTSSPDGGDVQKQADPNSVPIEVLKAFHNHISERLITRLYSRNTSTDCGNGWVVSAHDNGDTRDVEIRREDIVWNKIQKTRAGITWLVADGKPIWYSRMMRSVEG